MPPVLLSLANCYRRSAAASPGARRDFTIDYETFLRDAALADGDDRELAESDLIVAERDSLGLLAVDRDKRSGQPLRIRLKSDGGAAWLFQRIGQPAPGDQRSDLAAFFREAAMMDFPGFPAWKAWCEGLCQRASDGGAIQPFRRDDPAGNRELLDILAGVLRWKGESLIRFASAVICGNSKALENTEGKLLIALREILGNENASLDDLGILKKPRTLHFHGSLLLELEKGTIDFSALPGPCAISETNLLAARSVTTSAALCLTVENEEVFIELAKHNPNWLMILSSFPGAATRRLFRLLPPGLPCFHFGDSDPAGFEILRDLREKTGRDFQPVLMHHRPDPSAPPLTKSEQSTLDRLLAHPLMADVLPALEAMREMNSKGRFEQETVPIPDVIAFLARLH